MLWIICVRSNSRYHSKIMQSNITEIMKKLSLIAFKYFHYRFCCHHSKWCIPTHPTWWRFVGQVSFSYVDDILVVGSAPVSMNQKTILNCRSKGVTIRLPFLPFFLMTMHWMKNFPTTTLVGDPWHKIGGGKLCYRMYKILWCWNLLLTLH